MNSCTSRLSPSSTRCADVSGKSNMTHLSEAAFTPAAGCAATCTDSNVRSGLPRPPCQRKGSCQHNRKTSPSTKNTPVCLHAATPDRVRRKIIAAPFWRQSSKTGPRNASTAGRKALQGTQEQKVSRVTKEEKEVCCSIEAPAPCRHASSPSSMHGSRCPRSREGPSS